MKYLFFLFSFCAASTSNAQIPQLLKDVNPGAADGAGGISVVNDILFFYGLEASHGQEPWWSDGTPAGTVMLKDLTPGAASSNYSYNPFYYNGKYYLNGNDTANGIGLLETDLTDVGTHLFKDFGLNGQPAATKKVAELNGQMLLACQDSLGYNARLYISDGTLANTQLVKPGSYYCDYGTNFLTMNNKLYFTGRIDTGGNRGLWVSDGTAPGTRQLYPFLGCSQLTQISGEQFVLSAWDIPTGIEPWISDGTPNGTSLIKELQPGQSVTTPYNYTSFNGKLYFRADSAQYSNSLWVTDGTEQGTSMICLPPPMVVKHIGWVVNGNLLFIAYDITGGSELWRTDGTQAGTVRVADINIGSGTGVTSSSFVSINNQLYFVADDGNHGREIWVTDGYSASMVYDLNPGIANGWIGGMTNIGNRIFFVGNNGSSGREIFYFDVFPTAVSETETASKLNIYPNPASNTVTIDMFENTEGATAILLNAVGQKVLRQGGITTNKFTLDISSQPAGMYLLEVQQKNSITRSKLIKN